MNSQSPRRSELVLNEQFLYDGIVIALIVSVVNNVYDIDFLNLLNEFILILVVWYGIVEHFTRYSNVINIDVRYRLLFYGSFLIGTALNSFMAKTYGFAFIPIVFVPMLVTLLIDYEFGASAGLIMALSTAFHFKDFFMFLHLFPQVFVSTFLIKNTRSRVQVAKAGLGASVVSLLMILLQEPVRHFYLSTEDYVVVFLNPLFSSIAVLGILPYVEISTRVYSNIGLLEICTINHPLLKLLSTHAPGTYYHSLRVAELAEYAAQRIGANAVLVRACAYYHDVGKMRNPEYFIENLRLGDENPHDKISPSLSRDILFKHVEDGVEIVRKFRLPIQVEMAVVQHHGTRVQRYFYHKALEQNPETDVTLFRYRGPKPTSKELGILMLSDVVEATLKSSKQVSLQQVRKLIEKATMELFEEGQLDETGLSMSELRMIIESFVTVFENLSKRRIEYPVVDERIEVIS